MDISSNYVKAFYDSPVGAIEISASEKGITSVSFVGQVVKYEKTDKLLLNCLLQLDEYFNGKRQQFSVPLDLQGTEFQKKVWLELLKIPFGTTVSYLHIAKALNDHKAVRAVGAANGRNKIAIIIPCHRVIGSSGDLTGYAGGMDRKRWLLDFETRITQPKLF